MFKMMFEMLCIILLLLFIQSHTLQIDLKPGDFRCVGQELDQEDTAIILLGGSIPNSRKEKSSSRLKATVTDPNDNVIIEERIIIGSRPKEFQRTIADRGVYTICFDLEALTSSPSVRAFFHVDSKSRAVQAKESAQKVGKSQLSSIDMQLKAAEDLLAEISKEIDFSRRQEILLREAGDSTTTLIHRFGYLSIGILAFSSFWQLAYLRRFFIAKKLL